MTAHYRVGERVVYMRDIYASHPDPRAKNIYAERKGELYQYQIEKFWIVSRILGNGSLEVRTRRGKHYIVEADDRRLRRATWFEKLFKANSFHSCSAQD